MKNLFSNLKNIGFILSLTAMSLAPKQSSGATTKIHQSGTTITITTSRFTPVDTTYTLTDGTSITLKNRRTGQTNEEPILGLSLKTWMLICSGCGLVWFFFGGGRSNLGGGYSNDYSDDEMIARKRKNQRTR